MWNATADGPEPLRALCDELAAIDDVDLCAPVLLRTMERLDGLELGTPGPLVHTLERWPGGYERHLAVAVRRRPSMLALLSVNRILNADPPAAEGWLGLLTEAAGREDVFPQTKEEARSLLDYQRERHRAR